MSDEKYALPHPHTLETWKSHPCLSDSSIRTLIRDLNQIGDPNVALGMEAAGTVSNLQAQVAYLCFVMREAMEDISSDPDGSWRMLKLAIENVTNQQAERS